MSVAKPDTFCYFHHTGGAINHRWSPGWRDGVLRFMDTMPIISYHHAYVVDTQTRLSIFLAREYHAGYTILPRVI